MMPSWLPLLLPMIAAAMAVPAQAKPAEMTSRYTKLAGCSEVVSGDVERGEDWLFVRCKGWGNIPAWYVCMDSARCRYGFGRKANLSSGTFGVDDDPNWPIEWRGRMVGKRFVPFAVIMRARVAGMEAGSSLTVFRLRRDGMSCVIGEEIQSNQAARSIADSAAARYRCIGEPEKP